jgi:hypothetical protein
MRHRRDFLIVAALVTTWFALAQFPRVGMADHYGAEWKAGWPVAYQFWHVPSSRWPELNTDGEVRQGSKHWFWGGLSDRTIINQRFSFRGLLGSVGAWLVLISVVWFFTWPRPRRVKTPHPAAKV